MFLALPDTTTKVSADVTAVVILAFSISPPRLKQLVNVPRRGEGVRQKTYISGGASRISL